MSTIAIIGGGPSGYVAAITAARLGKQVVLVEEAKLGGTCLNEGCMPTKSLLESVNVYEKLKHADRFGIEVPSDQVHLNWKRVQQYKNKVVKKLVMGIGYLMKKNRVRVVNGKATFIDDQRLQVETADGKEEISAERIIIATGSEPAALPFAPFDGQWIIHSKQALELSEIPTSLLIIGGGVIGCEFASIFSRVGSKVTIIEAASQILPQEDADTASLLQKQLQKDGVVIHTAATVKQADRQTKKVTFEKEGQMQEITADLVLVSIGRKPRVKELGLERAGVRYTSRGIEVNEQMQTNVPHIYACGDVIGGIQLAHVAFHEGMVAASNACGEEKSINYRAVPRCIYTWPEIAAVGLTEKEAREKYGDIRIGEFPFSANGKALIHQEISGKVKVIVHPEFQEIIGLSIVGAHATELIGEGTMILHAEMTVDAMEDFIAAHPTLSEAIHEAVLSATGQAIHI
ncbi:dihydrolipoyl dehydrogenase [Thermoflavimicrobium dichotomicum]|uniref:Dihydrolipoyl dehydrogenase n=1 Tax=Thermoflavimicrobium dichotomicum TaxID=46223 RepID=A0A1I3RDY6_9BACL|nr:dihydrolipoyl dehydrogenase [Thermoflavimicrobium dichotomicum]SFJ43527.1 dihydrolipoamide dehydrogenase [Thermoflavimicrobium dichotomicum]